MTSDFAALIPVKPPAQGKSRLAAVPGERRAELAAAFALDTVAAVLATPSVRFAIAITDDVAFARTLRGLGCDVLPDGVSGDLNATLVQGAWEAERRAPGVGLVAVCADLPALASADLEAALREVPATGAAYVADVAGTGTTMYAARSIGDFHPSFGPDSARRHSEAGATAVTGALATLRQDVDDPVDLGRALLLGVGPHTAAASGR